MKSLSVIAISVLLGVLVPSGMCGECTDSSKETTLEHNKELFCNVGPGYAPGPFGFGSFVFRGWPSDPNIDMSQPASGDRTDTFHIEQVHKGYWDTAVSGNTIPVKYLYVNPQCGYPYHGAGMEVVIYGFYQEGVVEIFDCLNVNVYDCIQDKATFVTWREGDPNNDPCASAPPPFPPF